MGWLGGGDASWEARRWRVQESMSLSPSILESGHATTRVPPSRALSHVHVAGCPGLSMKSRDRQRPGRAGSATSVSGGWGPGGKGQRGRHCDRVDKGSRPRAERYTKGSCKLVSARRLQPGKEERQLSMLGVASLQQLCLWRAQASRNDDFTSCGKPLGQAASPVGLASSARKQAEDCLASVSHEERATWRLIGER